MYSSIDLFNDPSALLCSLTDGAAAVVLQSAKASSFPSQAPEYYYSRHQVFIVNRSFDFLAPHYVLNAFIVLVCVGFLSWSLDSSHGPDIKYIGAPEPTTTEEEKKEEEEEEKPVENISSIDPKADRRRSILKRTRARRLTIENIAKMIEIEDRKRQEVFGSSSSPLDNSVAAMDMGIGGGDVGLNVWSLNQEICLLREIDLQLENNGIMVLPKPTVESTSKPQQPIDKPSEKKAEITQEQEVLPEEAGELDTFEMRPPYPMHKAKKMDLKAHVLLRIRVPLRWVM